MRKSRRARHEYPPKRRAEILAAASRESLTALDVQKRFGVIPVTYYSWRKKAGITRPRGLGADEAKGTLRAVAIRSAVQARIRTILPDLVRSEVSSYLEQEFGPRNWRRLRT